MPELPEVETTVQDLKPEIKGKIIGDFWADADRPFFVVRKIKGKIVLKKAVRKVFGDLVLNKKILDIRRKAKNILIDLSGGYLLLIHQKMTGHLMIGKWDFKFGKISAKTPLEMKERVNGYIRIIFSLSDGRQLVLSDLRRFAKAIVGLKEDVESLPELANLGPEPLEKNFDFESFIKAMSGKKRPIKQVLMDPYAISGIGNIYSDEILWKAKINPFVSASNLTRPEMRRIFSAMKSILNEAVKSRGTSASDYRDAFGRQGFYWPKRFVYKRSGEKCSRCGAEIVRKKIGGRSAHFCPDCQKKS